MIVFFSSSGETSPRSVLLPEIINPAGFDDPELAELASTLPGIIVQDVMEIFYFYFWRNCKGFTKSYKGRTTSDASMQIKHLPFIDWHMTTIITPVRRCLALELQQYTNREIQKLRCIMGRVKVHLGIK